MSPRFVKLDVKTFSTLLDRIASLSRKITAIHLHHTFRPRASEFQDGAVALESMWRMHTDLNGWSTLAQHLSIAPDGTIWTGRSWEQPPVSIAGHNGNAKAGPLMISLIGDFNEETLEDLQRNVLLEVVARLQEKFGLGVESLQFARDLCPDRGSPGRTIIKKSLLTELRKRRKELSDSDAGKETDVAKSESGPFASRISTGTLLEALNLVCASASGPADPQDASSPDDMMTRDEARTISGRQNRTLPAPGSSASRSLRDGGNLEPDELRDLRRHVINLNQGKFSTDGILQTTPGDVDALFGEHLTRAANRAQQENRKLKVVFYSHGGLTEEASGLRGALLQLDWWMSNNVYPIFFVWETGLWETLGQMFGRWWRSERGGRRDLADFTTDPLIEAAAFRLGGVGIWGGMKFAAQSSVAPDGGAAYAINRLKTFCDGHPNVELHAVGHSAGAIFHGYFIPAALGAGVPNFQTVQFLAPAIRVDTFQQQLASRVGSGIRRLNLFTMARDWERADDCWGIYRKSLLYLIANGLESDSPAPILGLDESLRGNSELARLFGLSGHQSTQAEVIFSKSQDTTGRRASRSTTHGGFDNDASSMGSVARWIVDHDMVTPFPPEAQAERTLRTINEILGPQAAESGLSRGRLNWSEPEGGGAGGVPGPGGSGGTRPGGRALCVGINDYPNHPLSGCVPDTRQWKRTLEQIGFQVETLLDREATRVALLDRLRRLVTSARPGEVLVFQYSGHGTTLPDRNGDELGGDSPEEDEALCPVDFESGAYVIDDDIADVFREIPAGVNLTCFIDCCHSGTISRFAVGSVSGPIDSSARPRFIVPTADMIAVHLRFRSHLAGSRSGGSRGLSAMREVLFAACLSTEVAWERNGQGDFTRAATQLLGQLRPGVTHVQFEGLVTKAFGQNPAQHPRLYCAPDARERLFLGSLTGEFNA